jgi:hypothetical protein
MPRRPTLRKRHEAWEAAWLRWMLALTRKDSDPAEVRELQEHVEKAKKRCRGRAHR